ncbi:MAG: hypothetical protein IT452_17330 [Planctomycetia bacterium]|nr:hypothetical protein [Planctomycetia bacterium]
MAAAGTGSRFCEVLLFALAASAAIRADDCPDCASSLCPTHEEREEAALAPFNTTNGMPTPEDRLATLDGIEAVCRQHMNFRHPGTARKVAGLLFDADHRVRMRAAEVLRTVGEIHTAGELAGRHAASLAPQLATKPVKPSEAAGWNRDLELFKLLVLVCGESGVMEASPSMVRLLGTPSMDLLEIVANACGGIRTHEVATAILNAWVAMPKTDSRSGARAVALLAAWRAVTRAEMKAPKGASKEDFERFVAECRKWLKENQNGPEGLLN